MKENKKNNLLDVLGSLCITTLGVTSFRNSKSGTYKNIALATAVAGVISTVLKLSKSENQTENCVEEKQDINSQLKDLIEDPQKMNTTENWISRTKNTVEKAITR